MIRIESVLFEYPDGRRHRVHFDKVPFHVEDVEAFKKRLPTEAKLHVTYTEDDYKGDIYINRPDKNVR